MRNENDIYTSALSAYLNEISKFSLLSLDDERDLFQKMADGDNDAKRKLIESNLALVIPVAKKYCGRGVPFLDLIQEGNLGLQKAVENFDLSYGTKLSTFAVPLIEQAIIKAIRGQARMIKISQHFYYKIQEYNRVEQDLEEKLGRTPTIDEIAKAMNLSISKIEMIINYKKEALSLNYQVGDSDDEKDFGYFANVDDNNPEDIVIKNEYFEEIKRALKKCNLTKREYDVILYRIGAIDGPKTFQEIADIYDVTRQSIQKNEAKALKKIRENKHKFM